MLIPVSTGLLGKNGRDLLPEKTRVLQLKETKQRFTFDNIAEKPVPSILRGFSAPVTLTSDLTDGDLLFLMANDSDGFNRWDAGQTYLQRLVLGMAAGRVKEVPQACLDVVGALLDDKKSDRALLAKALSLPSENYLAQLMEVVDVDGLYNARKGLMAIIGRAHYNPFRHVFDDNMDNGAYSALPIPIGKRRLKSAALRYLQAANEAEAVSLAAQQYRVAKNMTDKVTSLAVLSDSQSPERDAAFADFYGAWKGDPLVLDKWFSLQAIADRQDCVEMVTQLTGHADFTYKNPNRLRALLGSFSNGNQKWFHRNDGAGYRLLADTIIKVNGINPSTAARLLTPLRQWRRYDTLRKSLMENELKRILSEKGISNDVYEIASKSLS